MATVAFGTRGTAAGHEYRLLSCSWHERAIYRASGVKLVLCQCGDGKGCRDLSAEHSIRITVVTAARPVASVTPLSNITRTEKNLNIKILHKCSGFVSGPSEHSLREPSSACILRIEELLPEALPVNLPGPLSRR